MDDNQPSRGAATTDGTPMSDMNIMSLRTPHSCQNEPAASSHSLAILNEFPSEVLAWMFLFVRGPPASGALNESRLVCKRWREIIDAHLNLEKPREPYITALALGYLSPANLFRPPAMLDSSQYDEFVVFILHEHDSGLFGEAKALMMSCPGISETTQLNIQSLLEWKANRVCVGAWEDLSSLDIAQHIDSLHAADLGRARGLGVLVREVDLRRMFYSDHASEKHFVAWSNDDLIAALWGEDLRLVVGALPWLVRRGVVDETTIGRWLGQVLVRGLVFVGEEDEYDTRVHAVLTIIEERGWEGVITPRAVQSALKARSRQSLRAVLRLCPEIVRREVWRPALDDTTDANDGLRMGEQFIKDVMVCYQEADLEEYRYDYLERLLDSLFALGLYRDATVDDANRLLSFITMTPWGPTNDLEEALNVLKWLLEHLPTPTTTKIVENVIHDELRNIKDILELLATHCVPWDPLAIVLALEPNLESECMPLRLSRQYIEEMLCLGFCLPSTLAPPEGGVLTKYHCAIWRQLVECAIEFGRQDLGELKPTDTFLAQAQDSEEGRALIETLARAAVVGRDATTRAAYLAALEAANMGAEEGEGEGEGDCGDE